MKRAIGLTVTASLAMLALAAPALAQRDPAYAAARAAGQIGEKPDGYLGVVGNQGGDIQAMVRDINIKRKAAYTRQVADGSATIEQFAFTTGCNLIAQTRAGEKYMSPSGEWLTRGGGAPVRDGRCL